MPPKPKREHQWLHKLIGEWTYEADAAEPGKPSHKLKGTESVRALGGYWVLAEGHGEMSGRHAAESSLMTLGYDPEKKRYVGTWIGSMMANLWVYDGALDAAGRVLTLDSEGPGMTDHSKSANYRDVIEFISDDHRMLRALVQGNDGQWQHFMTMDYRRKK